MDPVRRCARHGFFAGATCPACDAAGDPVVDGDRRVRLSRFLSGALRHFPREVGLDLDEAGWTSREAFVDAACRKYDWADAETVEGVVATDPKGRFERRESRVRAVYGHSVAVDVDRDSGRERTADDETPDRLYHGTAPENRAAIETEGLRPMGRREVHLSPSLEEARAVGRRHATDPVVFVVDAAAMRADGRRVSKRGTSTYTTDAVPPTYLRRVDREG
nr:RNA 2'-phosphotransferase [Halobium salinum]